MAELKRREPRAMNVQAKRQALTLYQLCISHAAAQIHLLQQQLKIIIFRQLNTQKNS